MIDSRNIAREAPPEFARLSGCVIGAYNTQCRLREVISELSDRRPAPISPAPDPSTMSTVQMAEWIQRYQGAAQILIEIIKELIALKQTL